MYGQFPQIWFHESVNATWTSYDATVNILSIEHRNRVNIQICLCLACTFHITATLPRRHVIAHTQVPGPNVCKFYAVSMQTVRTSCDSAYARDSHVYFRWLLHELLSCVSYTPCVGIRSPPFYMNLGFESSVPLIYVLLVTVPGESSCSVLNLFSATDSVLILYY